MRPISQFFLFTFIKPPRIALFLFFIITGCTHFGIIETSAPPPNIDVERSYFPNGNIEYEAIFINDKLDGLSRVWFKDGTLLSESEYSNDQPHGIWRSYHPNGYVKYIAYFEYGKKNGFEKWFYENGQVKSEQQFNHGEPKTEIIRWKPNGTLVY